MDNQLISIVVPVYNVCNDIEACVTSLCSQSYKKIEIILVDDGSTDGSGEICDKLAERDERVQVYHTENGGAAAARNEALSHCKGEYIGFVDADDTVSEFMYEALYREASSYSGKSIVSCVITDEQNLPMVDVEQIVFETVTVRHAIEEIVRGDERGVFNCGVCNKLYSGVLFESYRFPVGCLNEDICTLVELLQETDIVSFTLTPMYYYNTAREDSSTNRLKREDTQRIYSAYVDRVSLYEKRYRISDKMMLEKAAVSDCRRAIYYAIKGLSVYEYEEEKKHLLVSAVKRNWDYLKQKETFFEDPKFFLFYYAYRVNFRISRLLLKFIIDI